MLGSRTSCVCVDERDVNLILNILYFLLLHFLHIIFLYFLLIIEMEEKWWERKFKTPSTCHLFDFLRFHSFISVLYYLNKRIKKRVFQVENIERVKRFKRKIFPRDLKSMVGCWRVKEICYDKSCSLNNKFTKFAFFSSSKKYFMTQPGKARRHFQILEELLIFQIFFCSLSPISRS